MVGSFLFSLGAGSLRPCIIAFGGDQFILPKQDKQLKSFYTYYYIAANIGMLTTGFILPVLRWFLFSIHGLLFSFSTIHWTKFIGQIHWTNVLFISYSTPRNFRRTSKSGLLGNLVKKFFQPSKCSLLGQKSNIAKSKFLKIWFFFFDRCFLRQINWGSTSIRGCTSVQIKSLGRNSL